MSRHLNTFLSLPFLLSGYLILLLMGGFGTLQESSVSHTTIPSLYGANPALYGFRTDGLDTYRQHARWIHKYGWPWTNWRTVFLVGAASTEEQIKFAMKQSPNILPGETFDDSDDDDDTGSQGNVDEDIDQLGDADLSDDEKELGKDADETAEQRCAITFAISTQTLTFHSSSSRLNDFILSKGMETPRVSSLFWRDAGGIPRVQGVVRQAWRQRRYYVWAGR